METELELGELPSEEAWELEELDLSRWDLESEEEWTTMSSRESLGSSSVEVEVEVEGSRKEGGSEGRKKHATRTVPNTR